MKARHKIRLLRLANNMKTMHYLSSFIEEMGEISNRVNAHAQEMDSALKSRDISALSAAIVANKKTASRMEVLLQRFERIVAKMNEDAQ